ncbi:YbdK family carboxylate-amine ligase [Streptomyces sp. NPDC051000]|uniref:carboxylate-amine ligase n=1 Tax=Streptomyces sp. NPDC051000 TaxID=3155520 RepID=UPI0033EE2407
MMHTSNFPPPSTTGPPTAGARALTLGVEEEFLLVDRASRTPVGRAAPVIAGVAPLLGDRVEPEFYTAQVEVHTDPVNNTADLWRQLAWMRREVARAAADQGCLLIAAGTSVVPPTQPLTVASGRRYREMALRYPAVLGARDQAVCGCHIHVGVDSKAQALALANRMSPWLPVLQAIGANSPFDRGADSGHASRRSVAHSRWPTVGPAPILDESEYEGLATSLVRSGLLLDRKMIYWYARPSEHVPTLEIRVADTNADLDTVVLLAALVRALAATFLTEPTDNPPVLPVGLGRIYAAHRLAAAHGLAGDGIDPHTGTRLPAWTLVDRLRDRTEAALAGSGDLPLVDRLLLHMRAAGDGASRQRAAYRRRGRLSDVVDDLAIRTALYGGPAVALEPPPTAPDPLPMSA